MSTADNVLKQIRAQLPGAVQTVVRLALRDTVADLAREALQVTPPTDPTTDASGWLTEAQWVEHQTVILSGTLSRMYAQPAKPYTNMDLAKAHGELFTNGLRSARTVDAPALTAATSYAVLLRELRIEVPSARDPAIRLAIFRAVDSLCRNVLQRAAPTGEDPTLWLSDALYAEHRELLLSGSLAALYAQVGQPWTNGEAVKYHGELWRSGVAAARAHLNGQPAGSGDELVMRELRQMFPQARDGTLNSALFLAADRVARDVLQNGGVSANNAPSTWLPAAAWNEHHALIRDGAAAELYGQPNQPWTNGDAFRVHTERFTGRLPLARANLTQAAVSAQARVVSTVQEAVPLARVGSVNQAVFHAVNRLALDVLQIAAPADGAAPADWLPSLVWIEHQELIISGALAWLYGEAGQPWANLDAARIHAERWSTSIPVVRSRLTAETAAAPHTRILNALRETIPQARDGTLAQAVFFAANRLSRDVLQTTPPADAQTMSQWMTAPIYAEHQNTLLHGALAWLFQQTTQAWASPELARVHSDAWIRETTLARANLSGSLIAAAPDIIMRELRQAIPQARDATLKSALFVVADRVARDVLQLTTVPDPNGDPATYFDTATWREVRDLVRDGAFADLYAVVNQPWTNADAARLYAQRWEVGIPRVRANRTAATAATHVARLMDRLRQTFPQARDGALTQSLFVAVNRFCIEVLQIAAPSPAAAPATWLDPVVYALHYDLIVNAAYADLYAQVNQPWSNPDLARSYGEMWTRDAGLSRAKITATTTGDYVSRLFMAVREAVPQAQEGSVTQAVFYAVDALTQQALQITPPDPSKAPALWVPAGVYQVHHRLLLTGALAYLYAEANQPWFNAQAAADRLQGFNTGLIHARAIQAGSSAPDVVQRILARLRTEAPTALDGTLTQALYFACEALSHRALQGTPPDPTTAPGTWLPQAIYIVHMGVLLDGALMHLLSQANQPWTNVEAANRHQARFEVGLVHARATLSPQTAVSVVDRIVGVMREAFPQALDGSMYQALFFAVDTVAQRALQQAAPDPAANPNAWLPTAAYVQHFGIILDGAMSRLYSEANQPWASADMAKWHRDRFELGLLDVRAALSTASVPNVVDRIMGMLREAFPAARDGSLSQAVFWSVDRLARDAFQTTGPDPSQTPLQWLAYNYYDVNWRVVLDGAMSRLYAQNGQPWGNLELAKAYAGAFEGGVIHARQVAGAKDSVLDGYDRLMGLVRTGVPAALDAAIQQAYFRAADELMRQALQLAPPIQTAEPRNWLPAPVTAEHWRLLYEGTLAELLSQVGQPWAQSEMAAAHAKVWATGLSQARAIAAASETALDAPSRVLSVLRVRVPEARDAALKQSVFVAADMLSRQWLLITPPVQLSTMAGWLPIEIWNEHAQVIIDGALADLYAQGGQPYFSAELAKSYAVSWVAGATNARLAFQGASSAPTAFQRIMIGLRTEAAGARDGAIFTALFPTVDTLARQFLQITPPVRSNAPATWLPEEVYAEHASLILSGTLSRLLLQPDPRYHNPDVAKMHAELWASGLERAREVMAAASANDAYSRMLAGLQSAVPGLRDASLKQEVWNVVDDLARNVLQTTPPDPNAPASEWLTAEQWSEYSRLIQAGALARILMQPNKPWTNLQLATVYQGQFADLVTIARADQNDGAVAISSDRIMQNLRVLLPGSKDSAINLALYNVIRNVCWKAHIWVDTIPYRLNPDQPYFRIQPAGADIVRVSGIAHARLGSEAFQYADGNLLVREEIKKDDPFVYVTMALSPSVEAQTDAPYTWMPADLWSKKHQLILDGVCAEMMLQANKPYSNAVLGQMHHRKYMTELNLSAIDDRRRGLVGGPAWRFPRFAQ